MLLTTAYALRLMPRRPGPAGRDAPYGLAHPTPLDNIWPGLAMSGASARGPTVTPPHKMGGGGGAGDRMVGNGEEAEQQMTRLGHAPPSPFSCGDLMLEHRDP